MRTVPTSPTPRLGTRRAAQISSPEDQVGPS